MILADLVVIAVRSATNSDKQVGDSAGKVSQMKIRMKLKACKANEPRTVEFWLYVGAVGEVLGLSDL